MFDSPVQQFLSSIGHEVEQIRKKYSSVTTSSPLGEAENKTLKFIDLFVANLPVFSDILKDFSQYHVANPIKKAYYLGRTFMRLKSIKSSFKAFLREADPELQIFWRLNTLLPYYLMPSGGGAGRGSMEYINAIFTDPWTQYRLLKPSFPAGISFKKVKKGLSLAERREVVSPRLRELREKYPEEMAIRDQILSSYCSFFYAFFRYRKNPLVPAAISKDMSPEEVARLTEMLHAQTILISHALASLGFQLLFFKNEVGGDLARALLPIFRALPEKFNDAFPFFADKLPGFFSSEAPVLYERMHAAFLSVIENDVKIRDERDYARISHLIEQKIILLQEKTQAVQEIADIVKSPGRAPDETHRARALLHHYKKEFEAMYVQLTIRADGAPAPLLASPLSLAASGGAGHPFAFGKMDEDADLSLQSQKDGLLFFMHQLSARIESTEEAISAMPSPV